MRIKGRVPFSYCSCSCRPQSIVYSKATITVGGTNITAPAAPDKVWPVDLGDGISTANVELIWHNTPDNEDGYIVQRSLDPNFRTGVTDFAVNADVTNFIDKFARTSVNLIPSQAWYDPNAVYYRVAALKGK